MKFTVLSRVLSKRSQLHGRKWRSDSARRRRERLHVERLESRELLSNDAPFIAAVTPANGSTTLSGQPILSVKFSEDVVASEAQNPANYLLFGTGGRSISIDSVLYDGLNHQVMISYNGSAPLSADQYTLFVRGDQIHDVDDHLPLSRPKQLVVANAGAGNVSLVNLPGNSNVQALTDYASPGGNARPTAAALADLRNTGLPDLIVVNSATNNVDIFRGLSPGVFEISPSLSLPLPVGANAQALVVANLTGTNNALDIAVANLSTNSVTVFLHDGRGGFLAGNSYAAGNNPIAITAGDFSGHGVLDLAVADSATDGNNHYDVTILPGDPGNKGKFLAGVSFDTGLTIPSGIAVGNNLKDNASRLATADLVVSASNGARVLFNSTVATGTPNFLQGPLLTGVSTSAVAVGQISRVNRPDIVATTKTNGGQILVFQNLGTGFFSTAIPFAAGANPSGVALGDLDGDGRLDVIVSNDNAPGGVTVLLNRSLGTIGFANPTSYTVDGNPKTVAVHVNSQTNVVDDVATANLSGNDSSLLRNRGDGTLFVSSDIPLATSPSSSIAVGDLNGDHVPDIVLGSTSSGTFLPVSTVSILLSQPDGTYAPPVTFSVGTTVFSFPPMPLGLALADLTGTGKLDVLVTNPMDGTLTVLANSGTGIFTELAPITLNTVPGTAYAPTGIAVGDFHHNGKLDVAISHSGTKSGVTLLAGNGDRTFGAPVEIPITVTNAAAIAAADFHQTGDGLLDLAVVDDTAAGKVVVLRGLGNGNFTTLGTFNAGENPNAIAVGDLNGDGFPDIAVTNQSVALPGAGSGNLYVTVLYNQRGIQFRSVRLSPNILTGTTAQFNSIAITNLSLSPFPAIVASLSGAVDNLVTIQSLGATFDLPHYYATSGGGISVGPSYVSVANDPFIRATTFTVSGTLVTSNLINNGTFETPDLTGETGNLVGWQTFDESGSHGQWTAQNGPNSPYSTVPVAPPPQGKYAAMLDEYDAVIPQASDTSIINHADNAFLLYGVNGIFPQASDYEGMHILYQDITIPATASKVTLSFSLYINNLAGFTDPIQTPALDYFPNIVPRRANQQVRVDFIDPLGKIDDVGAGVLRAIFSTTPNTIVSNSYQTMTFDVTALKGRTVRLRFAAVNNQGKMMVGVDDVKVQATYTDNVAPGVNGLHLRSPGFGATASFGGNSSDPTIVGQATDVAGTDNIASVVLDLRDSGTTFSNGQTSYLVTDFDAVGNFMTTLPLSLPGIYTVGVTAVSRGGLSTRSTFTFNYQGPSLTNWQSKGPIGIQFGSQGTNYKTVSGHITSIDLDPRDKNGNIIYVGTDNGGVWKTTDGGANWTPLTDFVTDANGGPVPIAIGGVAVDPSNPDTVYAATGVGDDQVASQPGVGVLKSADGGRTWTLVGSDVLTGARVSKIAVSKIGRDGLTTIYVAVTSGGAFGPGVYRSQDGGATWKNVLDPTKMFLDDNTTLPAGHALASVTDLKIDRLSDFEEDIWIGLGNIGQVPVSDTGGLWKSPNRGDSWFQIVGGHDPKNGLVDWAPQNNNGPTGIQSTMLPSAPGYPNGGGVNIGRVTFAQAQTRIQDEPIIYVLIGTPPVAPGQFSGHGLKDQTSEVDGSVGDSFGLYKSKNGGFSWTHVMLRENVPRPNVQRNWLNLYLMGHEAASVGALVVDPTDPNIVYLGGSNRYLLNDDPTEGARDHGFIRVDTRNMRDTDFNATTEYINPPLPVIPNDGDDIIHAGDAAADSTNLAEKGVYPMVPAADGYSGEGVFWYDLETTGVGQEFVNSFSLTNPFLPQLQLPGTIHDLVFDPLGRLLVGTEGGIYRGVSQGWTYDTTQGGSGIGDDKFAYPSIESALGVPTPTIPGMIFTDLNGSLQIADTTSVAIDPYDRNTLDSSQASTGWARTTGSLQWESTNENVIPKGSGFDVFAFDGPIAGPIRTGPRDPNAPPGTPSTVYRSFAYILVTSIISNQEFAQEVSVSHQSGEAGTFIASENGINLALSFATLYPPMTMNPNKLLDNTGTYQDEILYGTEKAFETDNGAAAWDQVSVAVAPGDVLSAMAFGPGQDVFYVGTFGGQVFVDLHGGADGFPNRSQGLPGGPINGLTVDPRDANTAYAMVGGTKGHVFKTTDAGLTWMDVSNNLPNFPAYSMVIDPRRSPGAPDGRIYVGTQVGVYVSVDDAASWTRMGNGMPNVPVKDLQFSQDYEEIVAGTLGRGVFAISTQLEGARVLTVSPSTPVNPGFTAVTVTFDHPVDPRTFTPSSVRSLIGPSGPVSVVAVHDLDPVNHLTFQVVFLPQTVDGVYTLTLAPTIQDFLGNPMDQNGNMINGEDPGDAFTAHFVVNTSDNGRFVSGLYHDLLARQADTDGFLGFNTNVETQRFGLLQPTALAFVTSDEGRADTIYNGLITAQHPAPTGYYQTLLGRAASPSEVAGWLQALKLGATPEQVVTAFAASPEFFQHIGSDDVAFITALYTNPSILGRSVAPSLGEINGWLSVLSQAEIATRNAIVDAFDHSVEYRLLLINTYFTTYLGRPATAAETAALLPLLQGGMTDEAFLVVILGSDEYFNKQGGTNAGWLAGVYRDLFKRPLDSVGQAAYLGPLQSGSVSRGQVAAILVNSAEYRTDLIQADFMKYLGRAATAADVTIYLGALQSGVPDEGIVDALVSSGEYFAEQKGAATTLPANDVNWINALYRDVLGRPADSGGSAGLVGVLAQGENAGRGRVAAAFVTSAEYGVHLITVTYVTYLHRAPGAQEVNLWLPLVGQPSAGPGKPSGDEVFLSNVLGSNEYFFRPEQRGPDGLISNTQWLTGLYNKLLGRAPDSTGLSSHLSTMLNAYQPTRLAVAASFDSSTEYRVNLVNFLFKTYLRRAPSATESAGRVAQLAAGVTDEQIISSFVSSPEYFQNPKLGASDNSKWLNQAYRDILGRDRDTAGSQPLLNGLNNGTLTRGQVADALLNSEEYRRRLITQLFTTYLGRSPTAADITNNLNALAARATDEQLIAQIVSSSEYFLRTHSYP